MKLRQYTIVCSTVIVAILLACYDVCPAVDPSVYWGKWSSRSSSLNISLVINNNKNMSLEINGRAIKNLETSFVYGKSAVYPFLFIYASEPPDEKDRKYYIYKYSLYLTIGGSEGLEESVLKGFYIYEKTRNDHHGSVEMKSFPVGLYRVKPDR